MSPAFGVAAQTDLPIGGLLTDLKQRGLLDSTLIQWGGEFGRTPGAEQRDGNKTPGIEGRDHHPYGFSVWLAGGGFAEVRRMEQPTILAIEPLPTALRPPICTPQYCISWASITNA